MRNRITLLCAMLSVGAIGHAQQSGQSQGLLSRLRGQAPSTRQQLQNESVQVAQPASGPQGYAPGVTFPQQQAQQQPAGPVYPAYPPQPQIMPYNVPPQVAPTPQATATPARSRSSSSDDESSNRSSSSSSRSRTSCSDHLASSRRSSSSSSKTDESESNKSANSAKKPEASEKKSESSQASASKSSTESNSSSALQKIVKKVESDESEEAKAPRKTKEEIEAEKAREAALKSADKATTVVASFLKLANDGFYSKATNHLAPAITKYFNSEISAVNGTQKTVLDELTANGTITMVTYVNTTVRGEGAVVEAELGYENGRTIRRSFDLIELENEWKIVLPVTPEAVSANNSVPAQAQAAAAQTAAVAPPPTAEQAAANATPLVLAPTDQATSAPAQ